jgi:Mg2+-importing ATPase
MLWVFDAGPTLFRSGWFVESLATQTLVIYVIRTRRRPFFRSRPSWPLVATTLGAVAVGVALPGSPLAHLLRFRSLPLAFFGVLAGMVVAYLVLVELAKSRVMGEATERRRIRTSRRVRERRIHRRAARFSHGDHRPG